MNPEESPNARRDRLIKHLISAGYIRTPDVERAMRSVPREKFVPENIAEDAYVDSPLPIGQGQTISAPHMVAIMQEELELKPNQKVLEIGAGSGYHAAVTAELVKPDGRVFTIERVPELAEMARRNIEASGYSDIVKVILGDGSKGLVKEAPFDRIFVAAGAPDVPKPLTDQLAEDGIMLIPVGSKYLQDLIKVRKKKGRLVEERKGGCIFVPLIGEYGYS
jgi:protein-L-isoaspartate(D-aspartate) O-methyltransferase